MLFCVVFFLSAIIIFPVMPRKTYWCLTEVQLIGASLTSINESGLDFGHPQIHSVNLRMCGTPASHPFSI